ncbi:hypothetical protein [Variovorax sp. B2]|nr:hypothetical protein [Variovorax sp. B2]PNG50760.1 hypothetical protein CHC07_05374 [Variovorax sp. B4]VTU42159.1 hypothetical protein H6P1_00120 [Variovorax sp. PBL-H6]VTU44207.1 hypothetical protein SRS16P1_00782 [Variovorax sp. SRS16]VTU44287.1 hypothetical protein E5P1_00775 [Variovorax sp. PBL-E5]VTV17974.1 hypothetical protein WDL1P1_00812 [Variovorax sp. WDL1]
MSKSQAISLAKLFALQISAQAMLVTDGMTMERACLAVSAVMFVLPFISRSVRSFYRSALGPLPGLIRP